MNQNINYFGFNPIAEDVALFLQSQCKNSQESRQERDNRLYKKDVAAIMTLLKNSETTVSAFWIFQNDAIMGCDYDQIEKSLVRMEKEGLLRKVGNRGSYELSPK